MFLPHVPQRLLAEDLEAPNCSERLGPGLVSLPETPENRPSWKLNTRNSWYSKHPFSTAILVFREGIFIPNCSVFSRSLNIHGFPIHFCKFEDFHFLSSKNQDSRATAAARRCCRLCPWATWQGFFPSKLIKGDSDVSESCSGKCWAATFCHACEGVYIYI